MPLLKRLSVFAAKTETVIGTPETITAADGVFNAYEPMIQGDIEVQELEGQGSFDYLPGVPGARGGTCTFRTDVIYDGTTLPNWATTLLPACGWTDTATANTFIPVSEGIKAGGDTKTITIAVYTDGRRKTLAGCMGNFNFVLESGQVAFIEWTFQGVWQDVTDEALIAPTYPVETPARFADSATSFDGVNICVAALGINGGNDVQLRECPDTVAGYESGIIVNRYPIINADPEAQIVADNDVYSKWTNGTQGIFTTQLKTAADSTIDLTAPNAQIWGIVEGDRNSMVTDDLEFRCGKNGATIDRSLQIIFTPKTP